MTSRSALRGRPAALRSAAHRHDPDRRRAWVSLLLLPVAFVLSMVVGEGVLALQGYESGATDSAPFGAVALAAVPAMAVLLTSPLAAVYFGRRSDRRHPGAGGSDPATVGFVLAVVFVLMNGLPLLLR
jgi:hypothetical protein